MILWFWVTPFNLFFVPFLCVLLTCQNLCMSYYPHLHADVTCFATWLNASYSPSTPKTEAALFSTDGISFRHPKNRNTTLDPGICCFSRHGRGQLLALAGLGVGALGPRRGPTCRSWLGCARVRCALPRASSCSPANEREEPKKEVSLKRTFCFFVGGGGSRSVAL